MAQSRPIVSGIEGRYASALFDLADAEGALDAVGTALDRLIAMIDASADLARLVRNPVFTAEEQVLALTALLKKAEIDGLAANFVKLVATKRRLPALKGMVEAYRQLVAQKSGVVSAEVTVAASLTDKNRAAILDALSVRSGKNVALSERVDPAIIGGLIIKMGSQMIDASLKTKLNAMKIAMKNG